MRNYKSIGKCDIPLRPFTIVVGRNGSGKSNFLDALRFIVESLQTSLDHAIKARGGVDAVRRRSTGHPRNFAIEVEMALPAWQTAAYGFEIASRQAPDRKPGGFRVRRERLHVRDARGEMVVAYDVKHGEVASATFETRPPSVADRLYLVTAAGLPQVRPVYDALLSMGFYNLNPDSMKELQSPDAGELLHRDGANAASVLSRLASESPGSLARIKDYLDTIVPGIVEVDRVALGPKETIEFRQRVQGSDHPWKFYANSMSDGTLRALGILVAVTQLSHRTSPVRLVGIEEPETALHPAAAGALMDALNEAAAHTQVLVTTHSPDLLDQVDFNEHALLITVSTEGTTRIAPPDPASMEAIRNHLYNPGDLQRMDQLALDPVDLHRQRQMVLFQDDEEDE